MAILAIFHARGLTQAQYETLRKTVNWEGDRPAGGVFHAIGFDEAGDGRVADVWESPEQLQAFVASRLAPAFAGLGLNPPEVAVYPLHNATAYAAIDRFKV
jgi:hypothetical protein